jgi:hypothetical protein
MIWHKWIYGRRTERLREGQTLTPAELEGLFVHLRRCAACRRDYDLAMGSDRLLASQGNSASLPPNAVIEALSARVFPQEAPSTQPMPWLVPVLASAAALLLVAVVVVQQRTADEFTPRQGEDASFVVKVFCDEASAAPIALDRAPGNRCAPSALYRFAYTSKTPCDVEMVSFAEGVRTVLGPPVAVPATKTLRPLGSAVSLPLTVDRVDISCRQGDSLRVVTVPIGTKR